MNNFNFCVHFWEKWKYERYLLKYSDLYYSSMPKSFTSYKSIPICTHQSTLAQTLIVKVLQNITANVCKSLANKQIHDDLLNQKLSWFVVETYVVFFQKTPMLIWREKQTSLMKTADDSLSCVDALTASTALHIVFKWDIHKWCHLKGSP